MRALIIIICLCFFSCGVKKSAIVNSTTLNNKIDSLVITKTSNVIEPSAQTSAPELQEITVSKKIDSINFTKNVTKRTGYVHDLFSELLQKNVSVDGKVDYQSLKESHSKLLGYISVLQMIYTKLDEINKSEILPYWINTYNALTIDLILRNYPLKSIKDIEKPWNQRLWQFGDKWLNLNDIEHEILRKMDEPRIHFAIVCASISCPKLQNKAFTASNIDSQLTKATKEFLNDSTKNDITQNNLRLSKIFKWFAKDFKTKGSLIDFLNTYVDIEISPKAKKSFKDYNWDLND